MRPSRKHHRNLVVFDGGGGGRECANGRYRYWAYIDELGKYLRVIVEPDGETVHNAFPDRRFKGYMKGKIELTIEQRAFTIFMNMITQIYGLW